MEIVDVEKMSLDNFLKSRNPEIGDSFFLKLLMIDFLEQCRRLKNVSDQLLKSSESEFSDHDFFV